MLKSLLRNLRDLLFPEKLPPLKLTSRPVHVRNVWTIEGDRKRATWGSLAAHAVLLGGLIGMSYLGAREVIQQVTEEKVTLVAPPLEDYQPIMQISKSQDQMGGGGGGGDRDKLEAPKGKLPKQSMQQITPPVVIARNENPALPVEPTVVIPDNVRLPNPNIPTLGDPLAKVTGPPSNGVGSGGGIGSGSGGGIGSGTGPGVGPGRGGGFGGGVFRVGGGVSAPRATYAPDPEYSEEARKAKYQGVVVLWLIVGPDGRPRDIKVSRQLGMGLDQKAVEAVRNWRFEPATKDGKPVAVQINVEVNFRLY
jgi:protein TonB